LETLLRRATHLKTRFESAKGNLSWDRTEHGALLWAIQHLIEYETTLKKESAPAALDQDREATGS